jgi:hypothetical protein
MSGSMILYLIGMALIFGGQRLFAGGDAAEWGLSIAGLLAVLAAAGLRVQARGAAPTDLHREAHGKTLRYLLLGVASLALYALSTEGVAEALGFVDEGASRWRVPFQALWPIAWLVGTLPAIALDLALQDSPRVVQPRRMRQAADNWLAAALGVSLVFPLNYLAAEYNQRWDLAYFKTTEVGSSTRAVIENLDKPVLVRAFQASSSDVTPELRAYFEQLEGPNLTFEVLDHASEPKLVEELKIRDNGYVAVTIGEDSKSWKVGEDLDKAKRNLRKLDSEFHQRVMELARGKQIAYFTTGHGELSWRGDEGPERKASTLKKVIEAQSYRVKELGLTEGLADAVPDDAGVVIVLGPTEPFLDAEVDALERYVAQGGALFVAVEPDGEPLNDLLGSAGLGRGEGSLASEAMFVRITNGKSDRANVVSNRFSSHESTTTLSKNSRQLAMAFARAGWLEETGDSSLGGKVTITVRSMADNWADLDGDLDLDEDEKKKIRPISAVASGPIEGADAAAGGGEGDEEGAGDEPEEWRVAVIADSTAFSDLVLPNVRGNQQYIWDLLHWLTGEEDTAGTIESEEDIKIQHTKEDQVAWFYGTILGFPLLVLAGGWARVRSRRSKKGGDA